MCDLYAEVWVFPKEGRSRQNFIEKTPFGEARLKELVSKLLSSNVDFQVIFL